MRFVSCLLALLLLTACAEDPAADNYGWGWHYDIEGATGLRLRVAVENPLHLADLGPIEDTLAWAETHYRATMACVGVSAPGPLVILLDREALGPAGYSYYDTRTILVTMDFRQARVDGTLRHEYVHVLLADSGFPADRNTAHDSPLFAACS